MDKGIYASGLQELLWMIKYRQFVTLEQQWEYRGQYDDLDSLTFYPLKLVKSDLLEALYA